ncbi:MAG TPA: metallophosphoesterase, partial [Novosphingobium sp.]|nr:metallophosphoesterase [Novosphingobium sp.]
MPKGQRVYAIGDIHGRLDLLEAVGRAIHDDDARRPDARTTVIFLGDLIDRGPDSAGVIDLVREWARRDRVRIISGNHEELFLHSFTKVGTFRGFLQFGGHATVLSYGVDPKAFAAASLEDARQMMIAAVPDSHREFVESFEKLIVIGDYLFVHAGVNPDSPLDDQAGHDCRWIREPFLSH